MLAGVPGCVIRDHTGTKNPNEAIEDLYNLSLNKKTLSPLSEKDDEERLCSQNSGLKGVGKAIIVHSFLVKEHFQRLKTEFEKLSVCEKALPNKMDISFVSG